ncbi:MAG: hypothetical protein DRP42_04960 [Tenericutes bacterium]|nr:MAG: hypothetical protein DRP42_04960 [Mycoplasmatota bacterium]
MVVKNNDLELFVVLNEHGHMINAGEYNDLFYKKASKVIIEDLTNKENLIHTEMVKHQVAID